MSVAIDQAPFRTVRLGGASWDLVADTRFVYHLELLTKRSYSRSIRRFLSRSRKAKTPLFLLLWALSSKYREANRVQIERTAQDIELGALVPQAFVELVKLPDVPEFEVAVLDLLLAAGFARWEAVPEGKSADPIPSTPEWLTGVDESEPSPQPSS